MPQYKVVAPLVQMKVRDQAGALVIQHFYAGAPVPETVDPDNLRALLDSEHVAEVGTPEAAIGAPAGTPIPGRPPNVPVTEAGINAQPLPPFDAELLRAAGELPEPELQDGADAPEFADIDEPETQSVPVEQGGRPKDYASKTEWQNFAVRQLQAQGRSDEEARAEVEGMSKSDLVARYGGGSQDDSQRSQG